MALKKDLMTEEVERLIFFLRTFLEEHELLNHDSYWCWGCGGTYPDNRHGSDCLLVQGRAFLRNLGVELKKWHGAAGDV